MRLKKVDRWAATAGGANRGAAHAAPFACALGLPMALEACGIGGTGGTVNCSVMGKRLPAGAGVVDAVLGAGEGQFVNY